MGDPRHGKETLVRIGARRDVFRDLYWPLIVDVRASLGVLANDLPGPALVIRE